MCWTMMAVLTDPKPVTLFQGELSRHTYSAVLQLSFVQPRVLWAMDLLSRFAEFFLTRDPNPIVPEEP
jgi:hypothetical protein